MPYQPAILGTARVNNFRLGYRSAALTAVRIAKVRILLNGVEAASRVRLGSLTIHDALNDAPNTAQLTVDTTAPTVAQPLRITVNSDAPVLLFNGTLQTVDNSYEGLPAQLAWPCTAIDDLARLNRLRPFGVWTNVSASTVAANLLATYAPGFTGTHIQAGLPTISVIFDGSEGFSNCLAQIAKLIGGYFYVEDLDLHLFQDEVTDLPLDLDNTPDRFLNDPPITVSTDLSQVRTRVYGRGHGENTLADVLAGDTIVPIADAVMFSLTGGKAISESQILTYTAIQRGGTGSSVGPGAAPGVAPVLALASGAGLTSGAVYRYAYTDVTAAGESIPSPLATITPGPVSAPLTTPSATPYHGAGLTLGAHDYIVTFLTSTGETTSSPNSSTVNATAVAAPSAPGATEDTTGYGTTLWSVGDSIYYVVTYRDAYGGETVASGTSPTVVATASGAAAHLINLTLPVSTDPLVVGKRVYRNRNGSWVGFATVGVGQTTYQDPYYALTSPATPPGSSTALMQQALIYLPGAMPLVTGFKVYRRFNGTGTFKLAATLGLVSSHIDTVPNGSLGADYSAVNTTTANQVVVTSIAIGPAGTTSRKLYRTAGNGSQLKLHTTLANNTATTLGANDTTADGSLGANAPTSDTSGLTQPSGQVNAGATLIPLASAGPFIYNVAGGWAVIGSQLIRYTGLNGNDMTGVPASGVGSLLATVKYGEHVDVAPALLGVTGVVLPLVKGAPVNIWVQRDDLLAQATMAALDGGTGIYETVRSDERRGEASLAALCDADLVLYSQPIVTITYATRDVKTKSGKPIVVNLASPPIHQTLTIQDVQIDQIEISPSGVAPRFSVTASSVRVSLESLLMTALKGVAA